MRSDHWNVFGPNGETAISDITYLNQISVFEVPTPVDGTYRISSGRREGWIGKMYRSATAYQSQSHALTFIAGAQ